MLIFYYKKGKIFLQVEGTDFFGHFTTFNPLFSKLCLPYSEGIRFFVLVNGDNICNLVVGAGTWTPRCAWP